MENIAWSFRFRSENNWTVGYLQFLSEYTVY